MDIDSLPHPISLMSPGAAAHHPLDILAHWLRAAREQAGPLANAMSLATVDAAGRPDVRVVLLQSLTDGGLVFFTNLESPKGRQLTQTGVAAACFHWPVLGRQVRVRGSVRRLEHDAADDYFATRPRGSQIGAHASPQSRPITDRSVLLRMIDQEEERFRDREVPRPAHWGGFVIEASEVEFWEDGADRLHDRMRFTSVSGRWAAERLAP